MDNLLRIPRKLDHSFHNRLSPISLNVFNISEVTQFIYIVLKKRTNILNITIVFYNVKLHCATKINIYIALYIKLVRYKDIIAGVYKILLSP